MNKSNNECCCKHHHESEHKCCCENNENHGKNHCECGCEDCNCENGHCDCGCENCNCENGHCDCGCENCHCNDGNCECGKDNCECGCGHHEEHHCCCGHDHCGCENKGELLYKINDALNKYNYSLTWEQAENEAAHIIEHHSAENNTTEVKKFLLNSLELTSLKVTDNEESILALVEKLNKYEEKFQGLPSVATLCVYPNFIKLVSESLEDDNVKITSVCGGFPSSQTFSEVKLVESALALRDGADEIDIVLSVGKFLSTDYESIDEEIEEIKNYCGDKPLKVILETGALQTPENIIKAAILSMYCGADFIKTSTGKLSIGATPGAVYAMCNAIKQYNERHKYKIGIKIAGGVKTVKDAVNYYTIVKETLGAEWLTKDLFRIGASSLANELIGDLLGKETKYF